MMPAIHETLVDAMPLRASRHSSDQELVRACAQGSERAWALLVERYTSLVYSAALRAGLRSEDAADVFQLVWIQLWRSIHRIRNASGLPKWLVVATRRLAFRARDARPRSTSTVPNDLVDPAPRPDEQIETQQRCRRLDDAVESLGGSCAVVIRAMFFSPGEPSYAEVSRRVGVSAGSVGPLRTRGLVRLRRILARVD